MRREIDLRRRVGSHPHLLSLFDVHRIRVGGLDLFVLSMEYADGGDYRQWLARTDDPAARIELGVAYLRQAANGLLALHRAGIVHLDVKPENMVCVLGVWKIADLDHACLVEELQGQDSTKQTPVGVLGTPGYSSPEMSMPGGAVIDTRSDIYSLGVVLRETLRPAVHLGLMRGHTNQSGRGPSVGRVLARCLKLEPNERFQSVDHVIELLETVRPLGTRDSATSRWPRDDHRWVRARRYLAEGRLRDARHLCMTLLHGCSHHPGARAVMIQMDRREHEAMETARRLATKPVTAVADAIEDLRKILTVLPYHEETAQLVDSAEQQVAACRNALIDALTFLHSGNTTGFAEALDRASVWNPHDPTTVDACVQARDLALHCGHARRKISSVLARRQYWKALKLTRSHKHLLTGLARRSRGILETIETMRTDTTERTS
jgi:hypothetical protein